MRFRILGTDGRVLDEGEARAVMEGGALVVTPRTGQPLRVKPSEILGVTEPQPFVVAVRLREGPTLELSQLGVMRTQLLAELGEQRADDTVHALLLAGVGTPERFPGALEGVEAEVRLYDDALVVLPVQGPPAQLPYSFIESVRTDASGYRVEVDSGEGAPLVVNRLARRTSEFVEMLQRRVGDARGRTAAFVGALLPGLGPIALRSVGANLRNGIAGWRQHLDAIEPSIWPALTHKSTRDDRVQCVRVLEQLGQVALGYYQSDSVQRGAEGVTSYRRPAAVQINQTGPQSTGMGMGGGLMGTVGMDMLPGGPLAQMGMGFGADFGGGGGGILAMQMLGMGGMGMGMGMGGGGPQTQHVAIQPIERGTLTTPSTDYAALTTHGDEPTVLAFMLCLTRSGHLLYEVLNEGDHATYVYRVNSYEEVRELNRALALLGFRVEGIYSDATSAGSRYRQAAETLPALRLLRERFLERVIHVDGWEAGVRRHA